MKSTLKRKILAVLCAASLGFSAKAFVACDNLFGPANDPKPGITDTQVPEDNKGKGDENTQTNPGQSTPGQSGPGIEEPGQDNPGQSGETEDELPIDVDKFYAVDTPEFKQELKKLEKMRAKLASLNFKMTAEGVGLSGKFEIGDNIVTEYDTFDSDKEFPTYYYEEDGQRYKLVHEERKGVLANYKELYDGEFDYFSDIDPSKFEYTGLENGGVIASDGEYKCYYLCNGDKLIFEIGKGNTSTVIYFSDFGEVKNELPKEDIIDMTQVPDYDKAEQYFKDFITNMLNKQNYTYYQKVYGSVERTLKRDGGNVFAEEQNERTLKIVYLEQSGDTYKAWEKSGDKYFEDNYLYYAIDGGLSGFERGLKTTSERMKIKEDSYDYIHGTFEGATDAYYTYIIKIKEDGIEYKRLDMNRLPLSEVKIYDVGNTVIDFTEVKENLLENPEEKSEEVAAIDSKQRILEVLRTGDIKALKIVEKPRQVEKPKAREEGREIK